MRYPVQKRGGAGRRKRLAPGRSLRMALILGTTLIFAALLPHWGVGQGCGEWVDVEVDPPNPTSNDSISLVLSGVWCNTCVPKSPTVSIVGHTIHVHTTNKDPFCFEVQLPANFGFRWESSHPADTMSLFTTREVVSGAWRSLKSGRLVQIFSSSPFGGIHCGLG